MNCILKKVLQYSTFFTINIFRFLTLKTKIILFCSQINGPRFQEMPDCVVSTDQQGLSCCSKKTHSLAWLVPHSFFAPDLSKLCFIIQSLGFAQHWWFQIISCFPIKVGTQVKCSQTEDSRTRGPLKRRPTAASPTSCIILSKQLMVVQIHQEGNQPHMKI